MHRHILHRLLLAKAFIRDAERATRTSTNDLTLSQTVVHLHDAVDNLLGAVATHRRVQLAPKDSMVDAHGKLESAGYIMGDRAELLQLNTMRNAIKHQGVPQNAAAVLALLPVVREFCNRATTEAFAVSLDGVSLADLVENDETRQALHDIGGLIDAGDFQHALEQMAILRFRKVHAFMLGAQAWWDESRNGRALRDQVLVFPQDDISAKKLECLELGIDPDELTRFEWLTPRVGYDDMQSKNLILRKEEMFWHHRNWTYENAIFCFNLLVTYLSARQKSPNAPSIVRRDQKRNRIRFLRTSVLSDDLGDLLDAASVGDEYVCWLHDFVDHEWQNRDSLTARAVVFRDDGTSFLCTVQKADVEVVSSDIDEIFR